MEETEEEEVSKNKQSVQVKQTQETFEAAGVRTTRIVRTTVRTTSSASEISSSNVSTANITKRLTSSLDESSTLGGNSIKYEPTYEPRSISASSLNKSPRASPDRNLRDEITIQELGKGGGDKKVYRTTAMLDLGKSIQRQPSVLKSDSIIEEGDSKVIITEPDDNKEGSLDKSEDSNPNSEEFTKSSQEDLPRCFLVAEERNLSHSAFQSLSRSHGSLDETKLNITEQKSLENLTVGGKRQVLKGGILEEESTEVSGTRGMLLRSNTGQENRQQWLTADTGAANVNSRSMESLREHRASFITRSEKDVRGVTAASVEARSLESLEKEIRMMSNRYRRTVSGEEVISDCNSPAEKKRGLFASGRAAVPSHLSLMPPEFCGNRRLTILSPHSPMIQNLPTPGGSYNTSEMWQFTTQTLKTRRKKAVVLPRLVLPGSTEDFFTG